MVGEVPGCGAADRGDDNVELGAAQCLGQIGVQIAIVDDDPIPAPAAEPQLWTCSAAASRRTTQVVFQPYNCANLIRYSPTAEFPAVWPIQRSGIDGLP